VRLHFAQAALERTAINTIYSHVLNPMIASRSYMSIEPIELWLDPRALRQGLVYPVDPDTDPNALLVQDSGMVPVSTQIAIVNPETCHLCHVGEYGEIWVQSEACAKSFYMSKQEFDLERFNGRIMGGDPNAMFVRTGDLGFLHNVTRPIGAGGQPVEMQVLFNLGGIGETFEVNGLNHFAMDIESSVEKCHRNISPGGSAVFQAGGLVVVLVEVFRKAYLASIVPVIVDAILNEHQLVVDMIAFVSNGDFPRSRLGEKQRGKILASWVTRKLRTIAQFGIRDPEAAENQIMEVPEPRIRGNNASMISRSVNNRGDMTRNSIVSESPAHMIAPQEASPAFGDGSVMSPDRMSMRQDSADVAPRPVDGSQAISVHEAPNPPMVALNDQPYPFPGGPPEIPSQPYNQRSDDEGDDLNEDNKFYDPNADPFYPYGETTPQPSTSDVNLPTQNRLPRLSITNPSELATYPEEPTPTTVTASDPGPRASYFPGTSPETSASPASSTTYSTWTSDSPYEDAGNPYTRYYDTSRTPLVQNAPASVARLDYQNPPLSKPTPFSPPPPPVPAKSSPQSLPTQPAGRGRATLPSQQQKSRISSYGSMPGSAGLRMTNPDTDVTPSAPCTHAAGNENQNRYDEGAEPLPQEALLYASRPSLHEDRDAMGGRGAEEGNGGRAESRLSDVGSVAGSVRRRYDGSGYDGW
jgi:hypothetical protein